MWEVSFKSQGVICEAQRILYALLISSRGEVSLIMLQDVPWSKQDRGRRRRKKLSSSVTFFPLKKKKKGGNRLLIYLKSRNYFCFSLSFSISPKFSETIFHFLVLFFFRHLFFPAIAILTVLSSFHVGFFLHREFYYILVLNR